MQKFLFLGVVAHAFFVVLDQALKKFKKKKKRRANLLPFHGFRASIIPYLDEIVSSLYLIRLAQFLI